MMAFPSLQLRFQQSKDIEGSVQVSVSRVSDVVHAFHAEKIVAIDASPARFILYVYSVGVPFTAVTPGRAPVLPYFKRTSSASYSERRPVGRERLPHRSIHAFYLSRGIPLLPRFPRQPPYPTMAVLV